jgi:hypothetical protein
MPASPALGFDRQIHRLLVREWVTGLALEYFQAVTAREPAHLLGPLDPDERGKSACPRAR